MTASGYAVFLAMASALWRIDRFGWGVIVFCALLFGIPYARYFLRAAAVQRWQRVSARVTKVVALPGLPPEIVPRLTLMRGRVRRIAPYHCRATYVFLANGALVEGWFALPATDRPAADAAAESLNGQTVMVRYNPRNPKDSAVEDMTVLGKKVLQDTSALNPKLW